jgi:hypothetical protein
MWRASSVERGAAIKIWMSVQVRTRTRLIACVDRDAVGRDNVVPFRVDCVRRHAQRERGWSGRGCAGDHLPVQAKPIVQGLLQARGGKSQRWRIGAVEQDELAVGQSERAFHHFQVTWGREKRR